MNRPEKEFMESSTAKVLRMIEIKVEGFKPKKEVKYVNSMRDFLK